MAYQYPLNGGRINATIGGNTAGVGSLISTGTLTLVGGNNITLSQNGANAITIDGGAGGLTSQSNQALSGSNGSFAFQTATFGNSNGLSFYTTNGSMVGSYTTPTQSNQALSASNGSFAFQTAGFSNANGVTFGTSAGSIMTASVATSYAASNHSHGNPTLNLTNISGTTASASNGLTLSLSAAAPGAGASINFSAGATSGNLASVTFANSNGIGFGLTAGTVTASHNGLTSQSNQALSGSNGSFAFQTATFGNSNGLSFYTTNGSMVGSYTTPTQSNQALSASNGSFAFQTAGFSNANGVTFGTSAGSIMTASVATSYAASNHSHGNPTLNLTNISGTTASASNGLTLSLSAAAPGGGGGINIAASNTTFTSGTVVMSNNGGALTIGSAAQSVLFSVPQTSSLAVTGALSISTTGSTISIGAPAAVTWSYYNPRDGHALIAGQQGQGKLHIQPAQFQNVQFDRIALPIVHNNATNLSGSQTASFWVGIYTRNVSSLSLASSTSASYAVTGSGTEGSYSLYGGQRLFTIGSTNTVDEGQYYLGIISRTTSGGASAPISQLLVSQINSVFSGIIGLASNASAQQTRGLGHYSATTSAMPSSIGFDEILGTAAIVLRQPAIYFASQTF